MENVKKLHQLNSTYEETNLSNVDKPFEKWAEILKTAAKESLTELPEEQMKPYISDETWTLIIEKRKAKEESNWQKYKDLNNMIKKQVRQDKEKLNSKINN